MRTMKLKKKLNNNVVIAYDENSIEHIVMGRGIAHDISEGDAIDEEKIERQFSDNQEEGNRLFTLIKEIPDYCIIYAEEIIMYAEDILNVKLSDSIYIALTDHINFLEERNKNGFFTRNILRWEIQRYYPKEYNIGKKSVELLEEKFTIEYKEDEAASIALHIVNAKNNVKMDESMLMIKMMNGIMQIIKYGTQYELEEEDLNYQRLVTHIRFFVQRIISDQKYDGSNALYKILKKSSPQEHEIVLKISEFVEQKTEYTVSEDEKTYLIIHIKRLFSKNE